MRSDARNQWLESKEFAQSVLDTLPQHIAVLNHQGQIVATNAAWKRFGQTNGLDELSASCIGINYLDVCYRAYGQSSVVARDTAIGICSVADGRISEFELEYPCPSPSMENWFLMRVTRLVEAGQTWLVVSHGNITRRKQTEQKLELLSAELNHRVKNTLSTIQGMMMQIIRDTKSLDQFEQRFTDRLIALARGHDLLVGNPWERSEFIKLLSSSLQAFGDEGRISITCLDISLNARQSLAFHLILHELATNATKYGALSRPDGTVAVNCHFERDNQIVAFTWTERGGPPVQAPQRKGFGTKLIEQSVASTLDGNAKISYEPDGLQCVIYFTPAD